MGSFGTRTSICGLALLAGSAQAQLNPDWIAQIPVGSSLTAGLQGLVTDAAGISFITGITGPSSNTDIFAAAFDPEGKLLWQDNYNGVNNWHDQARGLCLSPDGAFYVCGNAPDPNFRANLLVIKYDAATGARLNTIQLPSGSFASEHAQSIAADALGNVYAGGGTTGDGADGLIVSFDPNGQVRWSVTYDGPAFGPYSQDSVQQMLVAPDGNPIARIHGVMGSLHPDYVITKYDAETSEIIWQTIWGLAGEDSSREMVMDDVGDIYVTGTGFSGGDKFSTIKLRGTDGALLWQAYDWNGFHTSARGIALDGQGGVYITGAVDPDGDESNLNDNFYTVKRDAQTGAFQWSHSYGDNCVGCFDVPTDVRVDSQGHVLVLGSTSSAPYSADMILFVLDSETGLETDRGVSGGGPNEAAGGSFIQFDATENFYIGGAYANVNTGAESAAVFKYASLVSGCTADFNADGQLDFFDIQMFLDRFAAHDPSADINHDAQFDFFDVQEFLALFAAGCP